MALSLRRALAVGAAVAASGLLAFGFLRARTRRAQIRRLTLAFDDREREALQGALDALGATSDVSSPEGRAAAARAACDVLRVRLSDARRATVSSDDLDVDDAPPRFDHLANELRRRYDFETRRNAQTSAAPPLGPRGDEPGFVVVTVLVGLDDARDAMPAARDADTLREALEALVPRGVGLAALEVIWSPSTADDRLSAEEVTSLYPELAKVG
jgi:uncharacterized membrane protein